MKKTLLKVWGVVLTLAIMAGLLGASIPASAGISSYDIVGSPASILTGSNINVLKASPDGTAFFAYDNGTNTLYRSTNAGVSWTPTSLTFGIGLAGKVVNAMAISPNYASDGTLVVGCMDDSVMVSTNRGVSFSTLNFATAAPGFVATDQITSVAIGFGAAGMVILVGTLDTIGTVGGVWQFSGFVWSNLGAPAGDVYAVAFSPAYSADGQIFAAIDTGVNMIIANKIGILAWGATYPNAVLLGATATVADTALVSLAFGSDYASYTSGFVVGLSGTGAGGATNDVYLVNPVAATWTDLNLGGAATATAIFDVAARGPLASAVYVTTAAAATSVRKATGVGATVSWGVPPTKAPTGGNGLLIATATGLFVGTSGGAFLSAFHSSTDDNVTYNKLSLVSVTAAATLSVKSFALVDRNTMFLMVENAGIGQILYRTTDGGTSWLGVNTNTVGGWLGVYPSPAYATDSTVYLPQGAPSIVILRSTNGGSTWVPFAVGNPGTAPTAFAALDGTTYYVGYANAVYKSNRFLVSATVGGATVTSIALAGAGEVFVGTNAGGVMRSTDDALTFTAVGAAGMGANTIVSLDPGYATNKVIYAADPAVAALAKFTVGTSPAWAAVGAPAIGLSDITYGSKGELYGAMIGVGAGTGGTFRALGPATAVPAVDTIDGKFAGPALGWPAIPAVSQVEDYADGANNTLVMVVNNFAPGAYPYAFRLVAFTDAIMAAPTITTPKANEAFAAGNAIAFTIAGYDANWFGGYTYRWQTAYDTTFAPASQIFNVTTTSTTLRMAANTFPAGANLYVRVRVDTGSPLVSNWSAPVLFTTKVTQFGAALSVSAPVAGSTVTTTSPAFVWTPVEQATHYEFTLSDKADFSTVVDSEIGIQTNVYNTPVKLNPGIYYWRVRAMAGTLAGSWLVSSFTIAAPAPVVTPTVTTIAPAPAPTVTVVNPTPVVTVPQATVIVPTPTFTQISEGPTGTPAWAWVVIIIGAILLVAVIVLIVRTRRV